MLQRLSRNLRQLHLTNDDFIAALIDAERVLELGNASAADYLARASLYQRLDCPNAERFDLEHALLLSEDPIQRLRLTERLRPPAAQRRRPLSSLWERACSRSRRRDLSVKPRYRSSRAGSLPHSIGVCHWVNAPG